jgi:5'-nucleotidase
MSPEKTKRPAARRRIFCNRTLNLRSIKAIGYDMDYTLVHYDGEAWERRAYAHLRQRLADQNWPVENLEFDPTFAMRGLVIDRQNGNIAKANRFGYVKTAYHGTQPLNFDSTRDEYSRAVVELDHPRWVFLNTLFAISEACMYAQLVDLVDQHKLPAGIGYSELYQHVRRTLDEAHMEGALKAEILAAPEKFVHLDNQVPLVLLDQLHAGKRLMLITNSEWPYTQSMMDFAFNPHLPSGMGWKDLFELVVVSARKPRFFSTEAPAFEVIDDAGLLQPVAGGIRKPGNYVGGHASMIERYLGCVGSEILYVGDHVHGDVHQSKSERRWRTALIVPELEPELEALEAFSDKQEKLSEMMEEKSHLEYLYVKTRLRLQRIDKGYGPAEEMPRAELKKELHGLRHRLDSLDQAITPLAKSAGELANQQWGLLMRTGNDKSYMARQVERHADIYTSRVSNFLFETPFAYLRSQRGSLPHDS